MKSRANIYPTLDGERESISGYTFPVHIAIKWAGWTMTMTTKSFIS